MSGRPLVIIGCPVRDRAWVLPAYLAALTALEHPRQRVRFAFVINDCTDATPGLLADFARRYPTDLVTLAGDGTPAERGQYGFANLARLRNRLLDLALAAGADALFSVDSDVLVPPHGLVRLWAAAKDIIAARVPNDLHLGRHRHRCNFLRYDPRRRRLTHVTCFPANARIAVDVVGAAVLIRRSVLLAGCRYSPGATGEDEGFCAAARSRGFGIWVDTGVVCRHRMQPAHPADTI